MIYGLSFNVDKYGEELSSNLLKGLPIIGKSRIIPRRLTANTSDCWDGLSINTEDLAYINLTGMKDCCGSLLISNLPAYASSALLKEIIELAERMEYTQLVYYAVPTTQSAVIKLITGAGFKPVTKFVNRRTDRMIVQYQLILE